MFYRKIHCVSCYCCFVYNIDFFSNSMVFIFTLQIASSVSNTETHENCIYLYMCSFLSSLEASWKHNLMPFWLMWTVFAVACGAKNKQGIVYSKESGRRPRKKSNQNLFHSSRELLHLFQKSCIFVLMFIFFHFDFFFVIFSLFFSFLSAFFSAERRKRKDAL